jgi:hypothetical protein
VTSNLTSMMLRFYTDVERLGHIGLGPGSGLGLGLRLVLAEPHPHPKPYLNLTSYRSRIGAISGYLQKHRIERRLRQLVYHHFNETYTSNPNHSPNP